MKKRTLFELGADQYAREEFFVYIYEEYYYVLYWLIYDQLSFLRRRLGHDEEEIQGLLCKIIEACFDDYLDILEMKNGEVFYYLTNKVKDVMKKEYKKEPEMNEHDKCYYLGLTFLLGNLNEKDLILFHEYHFEKPSKIAKRINKKTKDIDFLYGRACEHIKKYFIYSRYNRFVDDKRKEQAEERKNRRLLR